MRGKRRAPEERVSNLAGPLPPCRVCGEQAAGFHYGVNTCEACKGFFRRSLLKNGDYECIGSGNCVLGPDRRKSCPKCRYLKCLSVGMSKDAIKTGRYTYIKRTQDILELQKLQGREKQDRLGLESEGGTSSHHFLAGSGMNPLTTAGSTEAVNNMSSSINNCSSNLPLHAAFAVDFSSDERIVPTPDSNRTPLVAESSSSLSSLGSVTAHATGKKILISNRIDDSKDSSEGIHSSSATSVKTFIPHSNQVTRLKIAKPQSPLSIEEHSDSSQESLKILQASTSTAQPSSSETSPSLQSSPQQPQDPTGQMDSHKTESESWHVYSESELDELISVVVSAHRMHVEDANTIPDEVLQRRFKECKERCHLQTEIFGHLGTIKKDEHDQIYTSTGLDVDGRLDDMSYAAQSMDAYIRQMIAFMKLIPGFRSLSLSDQTALVKASICDLFFLGHFRGYNREEMIVVEADRAYCIHQILVFDNLEDVNILFTMSQRLQNLHLTLEMVVVLKALCVFFPDRAVLEEPNAVEQLQFKIVQSLLLLLQRHFADKKSLVFAKILAILAQNRSQEEYCRKYVATNMMSGSYRDRFFSTPIVFELFNAYLNE